MGGISLPKPYPPLPSPSLPFPKLTGCAELHLFNQALLSFPLQAMFESSPWKSQYNIQDNYIVFVRNDSSLMLAHDNLVSSSKIQHYTQLIYTSSTSQLYEVSSTKSVKCWLILMTLSDIRTFSVITTIINLRTGLQIINHSSDLDGPLR